MTVAYPNIAARLFGHAHAIEPMALRAILDGPVAKRILAGERLEPVKKKNRAETPQRRLRAGIDAEPVIVANGAGEYHLAGNVAIIPVCGILSRRFDWMSAMCGWTTYDGLEATFGAVLSDQRVNAILMDVESPGGEVDGLLDLCDKILAWRDQKPIWAVANAYANSAAYAVAGCASKLVLPRLGKVGSIGCMIVHVDSSAADAAVGEAYTAVFSGARKLDGWGHAPLSSTGRDRFQIEVDHGRDEFTALVGRQGRITADAAMATEAGLFHDQGAVEAGLADAVMTFEEALSELSTIAAEGPRNSALAAVTAINRTGEHPMDPKKPAAEAPKPAVTTNEPAANPAAAAAPAALAAVEPAKKPAAGEACVTCGHVAAVAAVPAAAAVVTEYSSEAITETLELCAIAGVPVAKAQAFIAAKTPVAQVRSDLAAAKVAAASAGGDLVSTAAKAASDAGWGDLATQMNEQHGLKKK